MKTPRLIKTGRSALAVTPEPTPRVLTFGDEDGNKVELTARGAIITGTPNFGDWEQALNLAVYLEERSPFWKGDLLNYGYSRADWAGFIDAASSAWGLTPETLDQYRSVAKRVPAERRVAGLSFSHHEAVASAPAEDQQKYLQQAQREHLSVSETRRVVRKAKKVRRILKGQASELAKAQKAVVEHAHDAAAWCKSITIRDCADAEKMIEKARRELDRCETAVLKFRRVQGK